MSRSFRKHLSAFHDFLERHIIRFLLPVMLVLSVLYAFITRHHPCLNYRAILPYIITYESCNLTLLGLILTLVLGLRGGVIHQFLVKRAPGALATSYWFMFQLCCTTVCTIPIALIVLAVNSWPDWTVRLIVQSLGLTCFGHSLIGTMYLLYYFIYLIVSNDLRQDDKTAKRSFHVDLSADVTERDPS